MKREGRRLLEIDMRAELIRQYGMSVENVEKLEFNELDVLLEKKKNEKGEEVKYKHLKKELKEWKEYKSLVGSNVVTIFDVIATMRFLIDKHIEVIESIINEEDSDDKK